MKAKTMQLAIFIMVAASFLFGCEGRYIQSPQGSTGFVSQDHETGFDDYDCYMADDFNIRTGMTMRLNRFKFYGLPGFSDLKNATSFRIDIWADNQGKPEGTPFTDPSLWSATLEDEDYGVEVTESDFTYNAPLGPTLESGVYWISFVPTLNRQLYNQWFWRTSGTIIGNEAQWINPEDGYGYHFTEWTSIVYGFWSPYQDLAFELDWEIIFD